MKVDTHPILPFHSLHSSQPPSPVADDHHGHTLHRSHPMRLSTTSSFDSQHDVITAVSTPFELSPSCSKRDLGISLGPKIPNDKGLKAMELEEIAREREIKLIVDKDGEKEHERVNLGEEGVKESKMIIDRGNGPEEVIMVDWLPDDPENPFNWSAKRKLVILFVVLYITWCTAVNATCVSIMSTWGPEWFEVSREQYLVSLTVYMVAIAFTPLILAPASEVFGRNWIYQVTSVLNAALFIPQALSHNYSGLLAARWFQGMVSSVGNSMVGGTIADLFHADSRGHAMNAFSLFIFLGQAFGGVGIGWIGMNLGIQWCYGIQGILAAVSIFVNALVLRETRGDVLLRWRAKRLTKETGIEHVCASDLERADFISLVKVSAIRPLQYLITEPIVTALSTWIGFAWACIFLSGTSTLLVFAEYGFNIGQQGSVLTVIGIGGILGFISNYHQEHLYKKAAEKTPNHRAAPEARLYWAAYGGLMFPIAMYIFAWTGRPSIHWAIPACMLIISNWGIFCMYSGIFNYLADAYETYSSSAQAAQSFGRNVISGIVPLFGHQMYTGMGYPQASTLLASVALILAAAPVLLIIYGDRLRARSKFASALAKNY